MSSDVRVWVRIIVIVALFMVALVPRLREAMVNGICWCIGFVIFAVESFKKEHRA